MVERVCEQCEKNSCKFNKNVRRRTAGLSQKGEINSKEDSKAASQGAVSICKDLWKSGEWNHGSEKRPLWIQKKMSLIRREAEKKCSWKTFQEFKEIKQINESLRLTGIWRYQKQSQAAQGNKQKTNLRVRRPEI